MVLCLVKKAMSASESNGLSRCENPREMITCILRAPEVAPKFALKRHNVGVMSVQ